MTVTSLGNHSKGYLGQTSKGNGTQNVPVGLGWVAFAASEAGDEVVVQLTTLLNGSLYQGIFFQAEGAAAVDFTLFNPGMAADPDPLVAASTVWGSNTPLPAGQIVKAPVLFTCCRIKFTAPGTVYIAAR